MKKRCLGKSNVVEIECILTWRPLKLCQICRQRFDMNIERKGSLIIAIVTEFSVQHHPTIVISNCNCKDEKNSIKKFEWTMFVLQDLYLFISFCVRNKKFLLAFAKRAINLGLMHPKLNFKLMIYSHREKGISKYRIVVEYPCN